MGRSRVRFQVIEALPFFDDNESVRPELCLKFPDALRIHRCAIFNAAVFRVHRWHICVEG
mgnify:CR=1 FL=1